MREAKIRLLNDEMMKIGVISGVISVTLLTLLQLYTAKGSEIGQLKHCNHHQTFKKNCDMLVFLFGALVSCPRGSFGYHPV